MDSLEVLGLEDSNAASTVQPQLTGWMKKPSCEGEVRFSEPAAAVYGREKYIRNRNQL